MTPNEYQKKAHETSASSVGFFVDEDGEKEALITADFIYPALGLAEEAGEVAGKFAKAVRDNKGIITAERKLEILKELAEYEQTWINMENVSKNLDEQYSKRKSKKR